MKKSSRLGADNFHGRLELISKCCQEEDLITVFDINRDEGPFIDASVHQEWRERDPSLFDRFRSIRF